VKSSALIASVRESASPLDVFGADVLYVIVEEFIQIGVGKKVPLQRVWDRATGADLVAARAAPLRQAVIIQVFARRVRSWPVADRGSSGRLGCHHAAMTRRLAQAGNTVVPAILAIESLGFELAADGDGVVAHRGDEEYVADDPVALLGLIRLVELRSWTWCASDQEIDRTLRRFGWH
jgi:hypothetical protein